jgi:parvulin-like peptidyl-prolyl isomerase
MANPRESRPVLHTKKHLARLERERRQTRYILAAFIGILVIVIGLVIYGYVDIKYLQPRRPVAEVGDVAISAEAWQARVRMERRRLISEVQLYQQYQEYLGVDLSAQQQNILTQLNAVSPIGQSVLGDMVDEELIRQEAAARGISVEEQEVDAAIQASFRYFPQGTPTPSVTPSPVAPPTLSARTLALVTITSTATVFLTPTVAATPTADPLVTPTATVRSSPTPTAGPTTTPLPTGTPLTQAGFDESYRNTIDQLAIDGLSEAEWRLLYEGDLLRQRLLDEISADVPRTQEQVWARHILLAEESIAVAVRVRLLNGGDFAAVAAEVSTDTSNKDRGGDLGWFGRGAMVPEFETAAFTLPIGEISEPVKTQFGWHIIQVLARGEVALNGEAYESARQAAFETWLTDARTTYNVVTYDTWRSIVPDDPAAPSAPQ